MEVHKQFCYARIVDGQPTGSHVGRWIQVWRVGIDGEAHLTWERMAERINDELLDCAIFLYESERDAAGGVNFGGSGFLVTVPYQSGNGRHIYAVTNRHLIEGDLSKPEEERITYPVIRLNTKEGDAKTIPKTQSEWIFHPERDDLAITLVHLNEDKYKFRGLFASPVNFVDEKRLKLSELGAGDETFMIGRFIGRDERQHNLPVVRFGHMASAQIESIDQGAERDNFRQESFLVETHSISGFSGSPVFVGVPYTRMYHRGSVDHQNELRKIVAREAIKPREWLLGINWGHLDEQWKDSGVFPGMAGVVPAWKLLELLNGHEVKAMRADEEKGSKEKRGKLDSRDKDSQQSRAGKEIPVPTRGQFEKDLSRAIRRKPK
jgi:hypothetical protein